MGTAYLTRRFLRGAIHCNRQLGAKLLSHVFLLIVPMSGGVIINSSCLPI